MITVTDIHGFTYRECFRGVTINRQRIHRHGWKYRDNEVVHGMTIDCPLCRPLGTWLNYAEWQFFSHPQIPNGPVSPIRSNQTETLDEMVVRALREVKPDIKFTDEDGPYVHDPDYDWKDDLPEGFGEEFLAKLEWFGEEVLRIKLAQAEAQVYNAQT